MTEPSLLIYGIGNQQRNDDGAGAFVAGVVAAALKRRGITSEVHLVQQLTPDLAEEIAESHVDGIVFADVEVDAIAGAIRSIVGIEAPVTSSHSWSPALILLVAERLYGCRLPAWLVTVPGSNFAHGETISPATHQALGSVEAWADVIARVLLESRGAAPGPSLA